MNPLRWDTVLVRAILFAAACVSIALASSVHAQPVPPPALDDEIASRDNDDLTAGGQVGAISGDGRFVVFNNGSGIYRRDRAQGTTVRVDVDAAGQPGGGPGFWPPSISPDGRYVSFDSYGVFDSPDSNGDPDVYLKDMVTGVIQRVSVRTNGADIAGGNGVNCTESSVSGDGKRVAFRCEEISSTFVVYVRDLPSQTTFIASINQGGGFSPFAVSQSPSISVDGRLVGFVSDAGDLVAGDTNTQADAFVRDTLAGTTQRVSLTDGDGEITGGSIAHVSIAAGCLAAFDHSADNIVAFDDNGARDIFVRNFCDGTTEIASVDEQGMPAASGDSDKPSFSGDARYVAFSSNAALVADTNFTSGSDVYVRDRVNGTVARANLFTVEGEEFSSFAVIPRLSFDGRHLIYTSSSSSSSDQIVAVRNPVAPPLPTEDVDVTAFGSGIDRDSQAASISADGRMVVFVSAAQGFDRGWTGADSDAMTDIFVYDAVANCMEQASMSDGATNGGGCVPAREAMAQARAKGCAAPEICAATIEPSIDAGGSYVVFVTQDGAVAKYRNETEAQRSKRLSAKAPGFAVVLRNLVTNATFRLGTANSSGTGTTPRVAPGGGSVVFVTGAGGGSDSNAQPDVYRQRIKPDGSPDGTPDCVSCKDGADVTLPGGAGNPTINAGGTVVAFDQPNGAGGRDIVIRNLISGATQRAGTTAPAATRVSTQPSIDWSGTRVGFQSGSQLAPGDTNGFSDVYVFDITGARLALLSGGNGASSSPSFAGDGKSLAYVTEATDLDPAEVDANGYQDVHVQEVGVSGALTGGRRATLARNRRGGYTDGASNRPSMSYNGVVVAFDSDASNMLGEGVDANASLDIFVRVVPFNADRLFESSFE